MKSYKKLNDFGKYSIYGLNNKPTIQITNNKVVVTNKTKHFSLIREYSIVNDKLLFSMFMTTGNNVVPNRIGVQLNLDSTFNNMEYFGKGPYDHYQGKDESGIISIYNQNIYDQDKYVRCQEHGNKNHIHWAKVKSDKYSINIEKDETELNMSIWPYTLRDLHMAQHINELPTHDITTVNIDCIQNGLSDCFVKCDEKYMIKTNHTYSYSFYINVDKL